MYPFWEWSNFDNPALNLQDSQQPSSGPATFTADIFTTKDGMALLVGVSPLPLPWPGSGLLPPTGALALTLDLRRDNNNDFSILN